MGRMVNPDNVAFAEEVNSRIYVDKSGLIGFTNSVCDTADKFVCSSRPRRFGKSYAADMLTAYYSKGCDSRHLFDQLAVREQEDYTKYLNQCDVIRFDVQWCISAANASGLSLVDFLNKSILEEMQAEYHDCNLSGTPSVFIAMDLINAQKGTKFVVIIDEWDAPIRDFPYDEQLQDNYINFLRGMFKGTRPMTYIRLAYMTGILPIKRQRTQSALNNFSSEFTMLDTGALAEYTGSILLIGVSYQKENKAHYCAIESIEKAAG